MMTFWQFTAYWLSLAVNYAIIAVLACAVALWLYHCYKWDMNELRGQEALKKALRDAGYV